MKKIIVFLLLSALLCGTVGCGSVSPAVQADIPLQTVMQEILQSVDLPEMMELRTDDLSDYFGLEASQIAEAAACINANGYEKEEVLLLRAAGSDDVQTIIDCLQTALDNAAAEMQNYLPEQYAMIRNSKVQSDGLYVWLFVSAKNDQMQAILDRYLKK